MARRKRIRPAAAAAGLAALLFIILANLVSRGLLPGFLQRPADRLNQAAGGIAYSQAGSALTDLSIHYIDVGQGDSILVWCEGSSMVIDGGPNSARGVTVDYLKSLGISRLNYVVSTHPDEDHVAGLTDVVGDFPVDKLLMTSATANTETFSKFIQAVKAKGLKATKAVPGDTYPLGGASFTILAPNGIYSDTNDMSVVLRLTYKNRSFLFTGDASAASEADMLKKGFDLRADVLKVGHHGSKTATSDAFLQAVSPKLAVISVGKGNTYGLPDQSTLDKLKAAGVQILRTDEDGTIVVQSDGDRITYRTEK